MPYLKYIKEFVKLYDEVSEGIRKFGELCDRASTNNSLPTQIPSEQNTTRQMVIEAYSNTIKNNMDQSKSSDLSEAKRSKLEFKTLELIDEKRRLQALQDSRKYKSFFTNSYIWETKHPYCLPLSHLCGM